MVACPGAWKNFEEIEENLSIPELEAILAAFRDQERRRFKLQAALKGIDIDKEEQDSDSKFEEVKRRVEAKLTGKTEEQVEFENIGISVGSFDELEDEVT